MSKFHTGYEGPMFPDEDEKQKRPEEKKWVVIYDRHRMSNGDESLYLTISADGEVFGMLRVPDVAHVTFIRERIQNV